MYLQFHRTDFVIDLSLEIVKEIISSCCGNFCVFYKVCMEHKWSVFKTSHLLETIIMFAIQLQMVYLFAFISNLSISVFKP